MILYSVILVLLDILWYEIGYFCNVIIIGLVIWVCMVCVWRYLLRLRILEFKYGIKLIFFLKKFNLVNVSWKYSMFV